MSDDDTPPPPPAMPVLQATPAGVTIKLSVAQVDQIVSARLRALLASNPEHFAKYIRHHVGARWITMTIHTGDIIGTGDAYVPEDVEGTEILGHIHAAITAVIDRYMPRAPDPEDKAAWS